MIYYFENCVHTDSNKLNYINGDIAAHNPKVVGSNPTPATNFNYLQA